MTDADRDILNAELQTLVEMVKEAQRLFRIDCLSTCHYELDRIKRKSGQLSDKIDDLTNNL